MPEVNDQNLDNTPVDTGIDDDLRSAFGLPPTVAETEEQNGDEQDDIESPEDADVDDDADEEPDAPDADNVAETARKIRIKYNGEERELDEDEAVTLAQKGMNYDKVQERLKQQQDALDRTARVHGYKDHAEYIEHLDEIEQRQIAQQKTALEDNENQIIQALLEAGYDESAVRTLINDNPAIRAGREALQEREQARERELQQQREQEEARGWEELLTRYPSLTEQIVDGKAPWMTDELLSRVKRGVSPLDAYELSHRDTLMQAERKRMEQDILKQNRLNKRPAVANGKGNTEKQASQQLQNAFEAFGLDPKRANKYAK